MEKNDTIGEPAKAFVPYFEELQEDGFTENNKCKMYYCTVKVLQIHFTSNKLIVESSAR